jgi:hypothetical protein
MKASVRKLLLTKSSFIQFQKFFFNVPTNSGPGATPASVPVKTPEQLKIEKLMDKWPEYVKNPGKNDYFLIELKNELEKHYKYYQGDKATVYEWELPNFISSSTAPVHYIQNVYSFTDALKRYNGFLETELIFRKFYDLALKGDIERETYQFIIPTLKTYLIKADRNSITELYYAALGASIMNLGDMEYWGIIEQKLIGEKLYKYLSVEQTAKLALELFKAERGSTALHKAIEVTLIKHRRAIHGKKQLLKIVKEAYDGRGSEIMKAALNDPNIEVPGVDSEIPSMDLKLPHEKQLNEKRLLH